MNVLLLHPFSDVSYARLQAGMPGASLSRYASLADASPEALLATFCSSATAGFRFPSRPPCLAAGYWAGIDHVIGQRFSEAAGCG
jgi:hypothetical protein